MKFLIVIFLSIIAAASAQPIDAKAYFQDYLNSCADSEIRCVYFLQKNPKIGIIMKINLKDYSVFTVRDVYNWAMQSSDTRKLSHSQVTTLKSLIQKLPKSDADIAFEKSLFIATHESEKVIIHCYNQSHPPDLIFRLYDIGGGYLPNNVKDAQQGAAAKPLEGRG